MQNKQKAQSRVCTHAGIFLSEANICNNKELERMKLASKKIFLRRFPYFKSRKWLKENSPTIVGNTEPNKTLCCCRTLPSPAAPHALDLCGVHWEEWVQVRLSLACLWPSLSSCCPARISRSCWTWTVYEAASEKHLHRDIGGMMGLLPPSNWNFKRESALPQGMTDPEKLICKGRTFGSMSLCEHLVGAK